MKAEIRPPQDLEVALTMSEAELRALHEACTQKGRRSRPQQKLLEEFGLMLISASPHAPRQADAPIRSGETSPGEPS